MVKGLQCVLQVFTIQEVVISLWSGSVSKSPIQDGIFDEIDDFKFSRFYPQSSIKKPHFKSLHDFLSACCTLTSNHNHIVNLWSIFFVNAFSHVSLKITRTRAKKEKEMRGFPFDPCFLIGWCVLTVDSSKVLLHTRVLHRVILRAILCWSDTTDYLDCDKLTTMNKVCFLIVFGIGVQQVSESLFVRILFAELHRQTTLNSRVWVEYTCITYDTPPTRPRFITNFLNY